MLRNGSAEEADLSGWSIVSNGGDGWRVAEGAGLQAGSACFQTSFDWCVRSQEVDLTDESKGGLAAAFYSTFPKIHCSEYFKGSGPDCSDHFYLKLELRDANKNAICFWESGPMRAGEEWKCHGHIFEDYGGIVEDTSNDIGPPRYLYFEDGGKDAEFWAGHFGVLMDCAQVAVECAQPKLGISHFVVSKPMCRELPFCSSFNSGFGSSMWINGDMGNPKPWVNMSQQDPSLSFYDAGGGCGERVNSDGCTRFVVELIDDEAFDGGHALRVSGQFEAQQPEDMLSRPGVRLFKSAFAVAQQGTCLAVVVKQCNENTGVGITLALSNGGRISAPATAAALTQIRNSESSDGVWCRLEWDISELCTTRSAALTVVDLQLSFSCQSASATQTSYGRPPHRFFRFCFDETRGSDPFLQLSCITLFTASDVVAGCDAVATWEGHQLVDVPSHSPDGEAPGNLVDGCEQSKWLDLDFGANGQSAVVLRLRGDAPVAVTRYEFVTANDCPTRDPVSWRIEGSCDGRQWTELGRRLGCESIPSARLAPTGKMLVATSDQPAVTGAFECIVGQLSVWDRREGDASGGAARDLSCEVMWQGESVQAGSPVFTALLAWTPPTDECVVRHYDVYVSGVWVGRAFCETYAAVGCTELGAVFAVQAVSGNGFCLPLTDPRTATVVL